MGMCHPDRAMTDKCIDKKLFLKPNRLENIKIVSISENQCLHGFNRAPDTLLSLKHLRIV